MALHPNDDLFSYIDPKKITNAKIVSGTTRHWRTNTHSPNTLYTEPIIFKTYWNVFEELALKYGTGITEEDTIDVLWNNGVDRLGPVYLFSPIPSLATHISYNNHPINYNVHELWRSYK